MRKVIIRLFIIGLMIHTISVFISQQKMLDSYASEKRQYNEDIEIESNKKEDLSKTLDSLNSTEYIEEIAREKLDMYLPNERVYIDIDK